MKILLACDKFKGSLSADEVNSAVAEGFSQIYPDAEYMNCVVSDGGEGFVQALVESAGGEVRSSVVEDALGREVEAEWGLIPYGDSKMAAVIEMSAASGLWRITEAERDIMRASTYGTGQLIKIASALPQVDHIYLGIGGSATNDAGTGMAQALGAQFYAEKKILSRRMCPELLSTVTSVELENVISLPSITVACDVDSPLCGPLGASEVFGPQKGASAEQVKTLDILLKSLSELLGMTKEAKLPGVGAAGGLGFGLMVFTRGKLVSGSDLVAEAIQLKQKISVADIVITGEGKMDQQSLAGKGPIGVAKLAQELGKPCLAIAGSMEKEVNWNQFFIATAALTDLGYPLPDLIANAEKYLVDRANYLAKNVYNVQNSL